MRKNTDKQIEKLIQKLKEEMKQSQNVRMWRQLAAIRLRKCLGLSGKQIAEVLGYQVQTVYRLWQRWRDEGLKGFKKTKGPGGRKHAYLSEEEERQLLKSLELRVSAGEGVTVAQIHQVFETRVGRKVAPSTIYRLLKRHGWRTNSPRKRHPKSVVRVLNEAKNNSGRLLSIPVAKPKKTSRHPNRYV